MTGGGEEGGGGWSGWTPAGARAAGAIPLLGKAAKPAKIIRRSSITPGVVISCDLAWHCCYPSALPTTQPCELATISILPRDAHEWKDEVHSIVTTISIASLPQAEYRPHRSSLSPGDICRDTRRNVIRELLQEIHRGGTVELYCRRTIKSSRARIY